MAFYNGPVYRQDQVSIGPPALAHLPSISIVSDVKNSIAHWVSEAQRREDILYFSISLSQELVGQILLHLGNSFPSDPSNGKSYTPRAWFLFDCFPWRHFERGFTWNPWRLPADQWTTWGLVCFGGYGICEDSLYPGEASVAHGKVDTRAGIGINMSFTGCPQTVPWQSRLAGQCHIQGCSNLHAELGRVSSAPPSLSWLPE